MYDNQLDAVKTLLEDEAVDVNEDIDTNGDNNFHIDDKIGWSCLHLAAYLNRVECVQLLVDNNRISITGAYPSRLHTALHVACGKGHIKIVKIIANALKIKKVSTALIGEDESMNVADSCSAIAPLDRVSTMKDERLCMVNGLARKTVSPGVCT